MLAISLVVIVHASIATNNSVISNAVGELGVPIFLMISGYLIINRDYAQELELHYHIFNRIIPLLIAYEAWLIISSIQYCLNGGGVSEVLKAALFCGNTGYSQSNEHLWYMPTIIGLYVGTPILSRLIAGKGTYRMMFLGLVFYFGSIIPTAALILAATGVMDSWPLLIQAGLFGSEQAGLQTVAMTLYFTMGGLFRKYENLIPLVMKRKTPLACILLSCLLITILLNKCLRGYGIVESTHYGSLFTVGASIALFLLLAATRPTGVGKSQKILQWVSNCSFGVYAVHGIYFVPLCEFLSKICGVGWVHFALSSIAIFGSAIMLVAAINLMRGPIRTSLLLVK